MKRCREIDIMPSYEPPASTTEEKDAEIKGGITEYSAFFIVSLISVSAGFVSQMTASMLDYRQLYSDSTANPNQLTLLDLEPTACSIVGSFILSLMASFWGRKSSLYVAAASGIMSGIFFAYDESSVICIIVARALASVLLTAACMICPLYMIEIVHESNRGFFTAGCSFLIFGGMVLAYVLENVVSYQISCSLLWILPTSFLFLFFWLPESPYFLASKGKIRRAERSLVWMRRQEPERVKREMDEIIEMVEPDTQPCCTLKGDSIIGMATALSLYLLQATGGIWVIHHISDLVGSNQPVDAKEMHGIILTLKLISSFLGSLAVDRAGRKMLLYFSYGGSCLCFLLITISVYVKSESFHIVPLICLCIFAIVYGLGYGTITSLIALELTPARSRCTMLAVAVVLESFVSICILVSHRPVAFILGRSVNYIIPTVGNALGVLFVWMAVPETSHLSLKVIKKIQIIQE